MIISWVTSTVKNIFMEMLRTVKWKLWTNIVIYTNKQASRYFEYNILWSEATCISQVKHLPLSEKNGTLKAIILKVCFPLLTYDATKTVFKLPKRRAYLPLVSTIYDPNKYPTNHVPDHKWECLHTNRARQH